MRKTVDEMVRLARGGADYDGRCFISHANAPEDAEEVRRMILARCPKVQEIRIYDIGTIIAAHCGPGTVAVYFWGADKRPD